MNVVNDGGSAIDLQVGTGERPWVLDLRERPQGFGLSLLGELSQFSRLEP